MVSQVARRSIDDVFKLFQLVRASLLSTKMIFAQYGIPLYILGLIGVASALVPNQVIITVTTPDDLIASVTALTVGLRAQAQVIGLAIFYNRFVYEVTQNAHTTIVPAVVQYGIYDFDTITEYITSLTAMTDQKPMGFSPRARRIRCC